MNRPVPSRIDRRPLRRLVCSSVFVVLPMIGACGGGGSGDGGVILVDGIGGPSGDDPSRLPPIVERRGGLVLRYPAGNMPSELASPWLAIVDAFQISSRPNTTGDFFVELSRYNSDFPILEHADFYTPDLDVCRIFDLDAPDEGGGGDTDNVREVSGGDEVRLLSAGGTWLTIPFASDIVAYDHFDDPFPGPMPDDLTLSIPGAEFPAIEPLPIRVPPAPVRLSPAIDEPITVASEYRWVPADDGSVVRIVLMNFVDGDFRGFAVSCRVRDDGRFDMPAEVIAEVASLPGTTTVRYVRETIQVEFHDGVIVYQSVDIADD